MKKNVVIVKDTKGNTCYVANIKLLDENEINKAINEMNKYHQLLQVKVYDKLVELESKCQKLELDIKLDRGEITREECEEMIKNGK